MNEANLYRSQIPHTVTLQRLMMVRLLAVIIGKQGWDIKICAAPHIEAQTLVESIVCPGPSVNSAGSLWHSRHPFLAGISRLIQLFSTCNRL